MSPAELGGLVAATLMTLVVAMIVIVACTRVRAERQGIVHAIGYVAGLGVDFINGVNMVSILAALIVLALVYWSYRRTMRRKVAKAAANPATT